MRVVERGAVGRVVAASPIAQVAAEYGLALSPLGPALLVGRCAFEDGAVGRSLLLEPGVGRFRCLTCGAAGDAVGLVMRLEGVGLLAALERLAHRAGLDFEALFPEWTATAAAQVHSTLLALPAVPLRATRRAPARPNVARRSEVPLWALTPPPPAGEGR